MERNIDDFLQNPDKINFDSLSEQEFYDLLEQELFEAFMNTMNSFQIKPNIQGDQIEPLSRTKSTRNFAYKGKSTTVVKRQDKINLTKNKDLNVVKSTIHSAFEAIIAASNKTSIASQITSTLRATEKRLFQLIDRKIKYGKDQNNG